MARSTTAVQSIAPLARVLRVGSSKFRKKICDFGERGEPSCGYFGEGGSESAGQLGLGTCGDHEDVSVPTQVTCGVARDVVMVAGGGYHTLLLCADGSVGAVGGNDCGQSTGGDSMTPVLAVGRVTMDARVCGIAAGWNHSLALTEQGEVYSWGSNSHGQLGYASGDVASTSRLKNARVKQANGLVPRHVRLDVKIAMVSCGLYHSMALTDEGVMYGWGCNKYGQLSLDLERVATPTRLDIGAAVRLIATSAKHTMVVCHGGEMLAFGSNRYGQLALGNQVDQKKATTVHLPSDLKSIVSVQCGWSNSCVLDSTGALYICGRGEYGILGNQEFSVSCRTSFAKLTSPPFDNTPIIQFAMGSEHIICLTNTSQVYSFGWNEHFQLGRGEHTYPGCPDGDNQHTPCLVEPISSLLQQQQQQQAHLSCGCGYSMLLLKASS
eukprot:gene2895-3325_t